MITPSTDLQETGSPHLMALNWMTLVTESQPLAPVPLSRSRRKTLPPSIPRSSRTSDRLRQRSRTATVPALHRLHLLLRSHIMCLMVHLKQSRSPPEPTALRKRRRIATAVVASVSSCNSFSIPLPPRTGFFFQRFPGGDGFQGLSLLNLFGSSAACCSFTINISSCPSL